MLVSSIPQFTQCSVLNFSSTVCLLEESPVYLQQRPPFEVIGEKVLRPLIDRITSLTNQCFSWIKGLIPPSNLENSPQISSHPAVDAKAPSSALTIMTYNVCNPVEVQKNPALSAKYSWPVRKERVFNVIKFEMPDVICFQEIRNNPGRSTLADLWSGLGPIGYEFISFRNNPSESSLINVIGYKTGKLVLDRSYRFWSSNTPDRFSDPWGNRWGRVNLVAKFLPITTDKHDIPTPDYAADPIFVGNLHHGLKHAERIASNKVIIQEIEKIVDRGHIFVLGDFNAFPNDGGEEELALWEAAKFTRLTKPPLKNQDGVSLSGTWRGYPYDKYSSPNKTFGSQLDNIFTLDVGALDDTYEYDVHINTLRLLDDKKEVSAKTEEEVVTDEDGVPFRDFPSDHMPVIVTAKKQL